MKLIKSGSSSYIKQKKLLLLRIKINHANYKCFAEDRILYIGNGAVMSARSKIMMVSSNWRKHLVQNMMWVAQDRPEKLKIIKRRLTGVVKYPNLAAFLTTEFSLFLPSSSIKPHRSCRWGIGKAWHKSGPCSLLKRGPQRSRCFRTLSIYIVCTLCWLNVVSK